MGMPLRSRTKGFKDVSGADFGVSGFLMSAGGG